MVNNIYAGEKYLVTQLHAHTLIIYTRMFVSLFFFQTQVHAGFHRPTGIVFLPDDRLLLGDNNGRLFILDPRNTSLPLRSGTEVQNYGNMATIGTSGVAWRGELGLLVSAQKKTKFRRAFTNLDVVLSANATQDMKLDPDFPAEPYIWVYYCPNHHPPGQGCRVSKVGAHYNKMYTAKA